MENRLSEVPQKTYNIDGILEKGMENIAQLDTLYDNGDIEKKRKIIGSIFPEKLVFTG
ncbi:hypothetical protein [Chitinophaga sp. RAB17]|uniref:hypothetical protein n=1 Tax=Chitinophaga sp. RAB17 TaxID=3233049 RepID=UPI003F910C0E